MESFLAIHAHNVFNVFNVFKVVQLILDIIVSNHADIV